VERKQLSIEEDFDNVRLKKSDLTTIVAILDEESGRKPVDIRIYSPADTCQFDDLDELLKWEEPFVRLMLESPALTLTVTIRAWSVRLSLGRADTLGLGVLTRLRKLVNSRKTLSTPIRWVVAGGFGLALVSFLLRKRVVALSPQMPETGWWFIVLSLAVCVGWGIGKISHRFRHGQVRFRNERGEPVDWRERAWDLAKIGFGAVLGVLGTLLVKWLQ
jgi:hypothetical protein